VQFRNCDVKEFNRMSRSVSCGYVARKQTRQYDVEVFEDLAAECWQSHHQVPLVKRIGNNTHRWNSQELQGSPCASHGNSKEALALATGHFRNFQVHSDIFERAARDLFEFEINSF
jgi:hypothetical protein